MPGPAEEDAVADDDPEAGRPDSRSWPAARGVRCTSCPSEAA
ncbi:hypothetical protein NQP46_16560 [Streptomyces albus]|nr:hypothetical protein NQP46_16560 [Streptomyces albus]